MAFLEENDKLKDPNALDPNQQQQSQTAGSGGGSVVSQGSNAVGSGVNTGGVGPGGTGKWTNIQAYLGANQGVDTGASKLINDSAGAQFDSEKSEIGQESSKLKTDAGIAAKPVTDAYQNKDKYLGEASKSYDWNNNQGSGYNNAVGAFKNALGAQYSGPNSYAKDISAKSQQYGTALNSDDAFNEYLGDLYQNKAGGQLSSGGRALQTQLNISNEPLAKARNDLLAKYSGLNEYRDQTAKDTNDYLGKTAQSFTQNQSGLKDFLSNRANQAESDRTKAESDARNEFEKRMNSHEGMGNYIVAGDTSPDLSWNKLKGAIYNTKEAGFTDAQYDDPNFANSLPSAGQLSMRDIFDAQKAARDGLNRFYGDQDKKYENVGDQQRREWSTIQDILGTGQKKSSAFKVRG